MSVRLSLVVVSILAFQPVPLLAQVPAVARLFNQVLPQFGSDIQSQWEELPPNELPPSFRDMEHPINQSVLVGGFASSIAPVMVVFEFEKPQFERRFGFCRSRVSLYQFYRSSVDSEYADRSSVLLRDFKELVSFAPDRRAGCEATSLDDLSGYVLVADVLPDALLTSLWEGYRSLQSDTPAFGCALSKDAELLELGITRDGLVGDENVPYAIATDNRKYTIIHFSLHDGVMELLSCDPGVAP